MVQPVNHDFGSETATTVLGGLKGGLFYGALGTIAAATVGAAVLGGGVGAVALALNVSGVSGAIGSAVGLGALNVPLIAGVGAAIGGLMGGYYGAITSVIGGAIAGVFEGRSQVAREKGLANAIEHQKSEAQGQVIASARGDAIEQGAAMGYMQGLQDGQAAIMNQLAAQQQQMQAAHAKEHDCAPCKVAKKIIKEHEEKHHASHAEKITANAAEHTAGPAV